MNGGKTVATLMLVGTFAFSMVGVTYAADNLPDKPAAEQQAKMDNRKAEKKSVKAKKNKQDDKKADKLENEDNRLSFSERIQAILHPEKVKKDQGDKPAGPVNYAPDDIFGMAQATEKQCVHFLLAVNSSPSINCTPEELVHYYYEEAGKEGIRPDVAFVQALKETGFFGYGGTVVPEQNNYCGLGTTSATVQGGYFVSPQIGVRAHIQHLMAYASLDRPKEAIVDPRYDLVRDMYGEEVLTKWTDLNGRWAVPGTYYGQSILEMFAQLLQEPEE